MMSASENTGNDADRESSLQLLANAKQAPESMDFEEMETIMWRKVSRAAM